MKAIGIRVAPTCVRYAIVERNDDGFSLLNAQTESRLQFPAGMEDIDAKLAWLYRELERIMRENDGLERVCIKTNEFTQNDSQSKRASAYLEGTILLFCHQNGISVETKLYSSLGTRSVDVRQHAENRVGRTDRYWDAKMADAVIVAWNGVR